MSDATPTETPPPPAPHSHAGKADLPPLPTTPGRATYRRHHKGGEYFVIGVSRREADLSPEVVYRSLATGHLWNRPHAEFMDGRFTEVAAVAANSGQAPAAP